MTPKDAKSLANSPGTGTNDPAQDVPGPQNTPGKHEHDHADRMTKSGRHRLPTDKIAPASAAKKMREDLQQLVEALDRRAPQLERLAEATIARDAADLRQRAIALIRTIDAAVVRD